MAVETGLLPPRYSSPERIGSGGMGDIFLATDDVLGRQVVVKLLSRRYARDNAIRQRFTREALAAARLSGEEGAVTIYDVGEWEERPFATESGTAEAAAHANAPVPSIAERCRNLPPELDWVFERALAKDPAARYGSAADFVADIREALSHAAGATRSIGPVPQPVP